jgi:SAM-dependent methyltransferase
VNVRLDVGCGELKRGDIGIDIRLTKVVDVIADCNYLPFRDQIFDEVSSTTLLEHCLNPFNVLKEQVRVLKKGGKLRCETDHAGYWRFNIRHSLMQYHPAAFKSKNGSYNASDTHYVIFYPENVERMFRLLNLKHVRWEWRKSSLKMDRLLRFFPLFKENTCSRFIVEGVKE